MTASSDQSKYAIACRHDVPYRFVGQGAIVFMPLFSRRYRNDGQVGLGAAQNPPTRDLIRKVRDRRAYEAEDGDAGGVERRLMAVCRPK